MYPTHLNCSVVSEPLGIICYLGGGGPREELRDKKDSDSNEIQLDIEMNHASQILNALTLCGCWVEQRIIEF